tara:strand:- start:527 stop:940 length:414 start_codon:yes stop_codon:yes gene_type:complete
MKLINWKPNNDVFDIFDNFDHYFNRVVDNSYSYQRPNVLIDENEKSYFLSLEMPGIDKSDINITLDDGFINISAERKSNKDSSMYSEIRDCSYLRSFCIPDDAQTNKIKAKSVNGMLELEIPKLKKVKKDPKKIEIL